MPRLYWCRAAIALDAAQPVVGVAQVRGVGRAGRALDGRQPAGQAAGVHVRADVRARVQDDVHPGLGGRAQEQVQVADAGEVVLSGGGGVQVPGEADVDRVVAVRPHLLQDVPPQGGAGQPEGVHLARPQGQAPAVDQQGVPVQGDVVAPPVGAGRAGRRAGGHRSAGSRAGQCPAAHAAAERQTEDGGAREGAERSSAEPAELQGSLSCCRASVLRCRAIVHNRSGDAENEPRTTPPAR